MYPLRAQRFDRKTTHPRGLSAARNNRRQEFEVSHELRRVKRSVKLRPTKPEEKDFRTSASVRTGNNSGLRGGSMNTSTSKHHRIPKMGG